MRLRGVTVVYIIVIQIPNPNEVKMKATLASRLRTAMLFVSAMMVYSAAFASIPMLQDKPQSKDDAPKFSESEQKAIEKIKAASSASDKIKAAQEYVKKNAKSPNRPRVAAYVAEEVSRVSDHGQRAGLIENYTKTFNQPEEVDLIKPALIDSLLSTNKFEEAFNEGSKFIEKKPDDVIVLTQVTWAGANQAQKQSQGGAPPAAMVQKATSAGAKAVEMLEGDKKPEGMDATYWNNYRNSWLPRLYQAQGLLLFYSNDKDGAKEKLEKSAGLDPYDPPTLLMLSNILQEEYEKLAQRYQAEKKQALLNEALQKMDELIDWLARAAAATEGNAQFQAVNAQLMEQLKSYYPFRHDGKTDGLKELVQKYKKP
jgi:tetratricopeptide (TPR) repeat protein